MDSAIVCFWCLPGGIQIVLPLLMGISYFIYTMSSKLLSKFF